MAESDFGDVARLPADAESDAAAYADGYHRVMRELDWARTRGWVPTERQITVAVMQTMRVYTAARGGKFVGGRRPEWLRGRAEALRTLLHQGAGPIPDDA